MNLHGIKINYVCIVCKAFVNKKLKLSPDSADMLISGEGFLNPLALRMSPEVFVISPLPVWSCFCE